MGAPLGDSQIHVPRFEAWARKLFNIKNPQIIRSVLPGVQLGLDLALGRYDEQLITAGVIPFSYSLTLFGTGGARPLCFISNPAGSGMVAVIQGALAQVLYAGAQVAGTNAGWYLGPGTLGGLNLCFSRDTRSGGLTGGQLPFATTTAQSAALIGAIMGGSVFNIGYGLLPNAADNLVHDIELRGSVILTPGWALGFDASALGLTTQAQVTGFGYARALEGTELSAR